MFDFIKRKASRTGEVVSQQVAKSVIYTPQNYETYAKEGYQNNVIVYRCINEIASAVASLQWYCRKKEGRDIDTHPALSLIAKPNNREAWQDFIRNVIINYYISGNAYIEAQTGNFTRITPPTELHCLRSDRMRIIAGDDGEPEYYQYEAGYNVKFPARAKIIAGKWIGVVHHIKEPHPTNDWYGLSPLEPIAFEIDRFNAAAKFNAALLQNSAMPSGILVIKEVTNELMIDRVKQALYAEYTSPSNAGLPMVMSGDVQWTQMGINPKDLHLNETLNQAAQDIASAFRIPIQLILPISSTFNNMEAAKRQFYEDCVIPLANKLRDGFFNNWLSLFYPDAPQFYYDENQITALASARREVHDMSERRWISGLASWNETRIEMNLDTVVGGDNIYYPDKPNSQPQPINEGNQKKNLTNVLDIDVIATEIDRPAIRTSTAAQITSIFNTLAISFGNEFLREAGLAVAMRNDAALQNWIARHTAELITQVDGTTKNTVRALLAEKINEQASISDIKDALAEKFNEFSGYRSQMIATTEVTAIMGESQLIAATQAGINKIEWIAVIDGSTRDTHSAIDGAIVQVGTPFVLSDGDSGTKPSGFSRAENNINCRCAIAAAFDGEQRNYDDRRTLWKQKDKARVVAEKTVANLYLQLFENQLKLLIKRIDDVTQ